MSEQTATVRNYHEVTKHHPNRYAHGPGRLDWAVQPDPFRRYSGASNIELDRLTLTPEPLYDEIWAGDLIPPAEVNRRSVSQLFLDSLALSAWKRAGTSSWPLRVNPSAGNLHPIEGYLVCGPVVGLCTEPMVAHYTPKEHGLERRVTIPASLWQRLTGCLPEDLLLVGLASICWRSSWKYGERAYRYAHLDLGHALAAISIAAAGLGWDTRLVDTLGTREVAKILGIIDPAGAETEDAACLLVVVPGNQPNLELQVDAEAITELASLPWEGRASRLSHSQVVWPLIEEVTEAGLKHSNSPAHPLMTRPQAQASRASKQMRNTPLRAIIHQRRSALDFDGTTFMPRTVFYGMLERTVAHPETVPHTVLPWGPRVHLAVFVHRVQGLAPGLYLLVREISHLDRLRLAMNLDFVWEKPDGCPDGLHLVRLLAGDLCQLSMQVACAQASAGDGCFSLAMIADFQETLEDYGPWMYQRLHWECGTVGQILYLEAEAAGFRGCGLGCYFDDLMHEVLGLKGHHFQDLYHFTVGRAVEDPRITTLPAYP